MSLAGAGGPYMHGGSLGGGAQPPRRRRWDPDPEVVEAFAAGIEVLYPAQLERLASEAERRVEQLQGEVAAAQQVVDAARLALRRRVAAYTDDAP